MTELPELLDALNKAGYIDDNIRCEDNEDVIKDYNEIVGKYKLNTTKANKVYGLLIKRNYLYYRDEEAYGFILGYFYFLKDNQGPKY